MQDNSYHIDINEYENPNMRDKLNTIKSVHQYLSKLKTYQNSIHDLKNQNARLVQENRRMAEQYELNL